MATDLDRGAYAGKETVSVYNSATHATPTWVEMARVRNLQFEQGPELKKVNFHGASASGAIPGYDEQSGSFEYVRKRGTDTVYAALVAARDNATIIEIGNLDGPLDDVNSVGWAMPVLLGKFSTTSNGGDEVVTTVNFEKADAYDGSDNEIAIFSITGSA